MLQTADAEEGEEGELEGANDEADSDDGRKRKKKKKKKKCVFLVSACTTVPFCW